MEVYNRKIRFEATDLDASCHGWIAIDNIKIQQNAEGACETIPIEAQITTIPPATTEPATTKDPEQFPACKFEGGACGWTSNEDDRWVIRISKPTRFGWLRLEI